MDLAIGIFISIWIVVGIIGLIVSIIGIFMSFSIGDEEYTRLWARILLVCFVWPLAVPAALYWVICVAFNRHFPSFEREDA